MRHQVGGREGEEGEGGGERKLQLRERRWWEEGVGEEGERGGRGEKEGVDLIFTFPQVRCCSSTTPKRVGGWMGG